MLSELRVPPRAVAKRAFSAGLGGNACVWPCSRRRTCCISRHRAPGPSRRVEGYLDQVLQERRNHDAFARERIDVDASPELAQRYEVTVVPTILVVEDGRVLRRIEGRRSVSDLRGELSPWLR